MMTNLQSSAFVAKTTQLLSTVAHLRLLLVMFLTLCVSAAWGADITFTPSSDKGSVTTNGTTDGDQVTKSGFTITSSNGVMGNGSNYRVYTDGTLSITSTVGNITAISFTFSSDKYTGGLANSYIGLSTASWSASATSQARITSITITYTPTSTTKYTVTLVPGSGSVTNTELEEPNAGEGVTLPTPTLDCGDWEFAGWKTTSAVTTETTTKPTLIAAGAYKPASNITLYAVYQRTETTSGGGGGGVATGTISFASTAQRTSISADTQVWVNEGITFTNNKGSGSNVADYSNPIRLYKNSEIVISAPDNIDHIVFTASSSDYATALATSVGNEATCSSSTVTPTTGATSYTITLSAGQTRLKSLTVTYTSGGGSSSTTYYHSTPDCSTETLVSVLPKITNFGSLSSGYLWDIFGIKQGTVTYWVVSWWYRYITDAQK